MSIFPVITRNKQKLYETICLCNPDFTNSVPEICGYYGRACRVMEGSADRMLCNGCSLSLFAVTVDAILERCNEKEALGIKYLHDSDIYDIQDTLAGKAVRVRFSYIESVLDCLENITD